MAFGERVTLGFERKYIMAKCSFKDGHLHKNQSRISSKNTSQNLLFRFFDPIKSSKIFQMIDIKLNIYLQEFSQEQ